MSSAPPLSQAFGYGIVVGLGFLFAFGSTFSPATTVTGQKSERILRESAVEVLLRLMS